MIEPTIGRVVWYWPEGTRNRPVGAQPLAALIAYVHSRNTVNLAVMESKGGTYGRMHVQLYQGEGEAPEFTSYAEWMPYQLEQAKANAAALPPSHLANLGKVAYDAYCADTGGVSLVSGNKLPQWEYLPTDICRAWSAAADAVLLANGRKT